MFKFVNRHGHSGYQQCELLYLELIGSNLDMGYYNLSDVSKWHCLFFHPWGRLYWLTRAVINGCANHVQGIRVNRNWSQLMKLNHVKSQNLLTFNFQLWLFDIFIKYQVILFIGHSRVNNSNSVDKKSSTRI